MSAFQELQTDAVRRIWRRRGNAAPGRAVADRDGEAGNLAQIADPVLHRPSGEAVPFAGPVRRLHDRAFEHKNIERDFAADEAAQHALEIFAEFHAERGVPQDIDAEVGDEIARARLLGIQERHRIAGACPALEPQKIGHSSSP